MNLNEAIYIGEQIIVDREKNDSVIFKDPAITHLQIFEAVSILAKQLQLVQNRCAKNRETCQKDRTTII